MGASTKTCMQLTPSDAAALIEEGAIVNGPFASQALCQAQCFSSSNKWYCVSGSVIIKNCSSSPASGSDFLPSGVTEIALEITGAGFGFGNFGGVTVGGGGGGWARWNSIPITSGLLYAYALGQAGFPTQSSETHFDFFNPTIWRVDGAIGIHGGSGSAPPGGYKIPDVFYNGGDGGFLNSVPTGNPCSQCTSSVGGAGGSAASPLGPGANGESGHYPAPAAGGVGIGGAGSGGNAGYVWTPQDTAKAIVTVNLSNEITGISSITHGGSGYPPSATINLFVDSKDTQYFGGIVSVVTNASGSVVSFSSVVNPGTGFYATGGEHYLVMSVTAPGHDGAIPGGGGGSSSTSVTLAAAVYRGLGGCGQIKIFLNPNDTVGPVIIVGAGGDPGLQSQCLYLSDDDANTLKNIGYNVLGPYLTPFDCDVACGDVYLSSSSLSSMSSLSSLSSQSSSSS